LSKASILIVEDESIIALDIRGNLESNDYQVAGQADSGEDAVTKAGELHPNLVLMDIVLKGEMDGIEAAKQIRKKFNIPVIFLTAFSNTSTLARAQLAEPFGYILKPYEERELIGNIEIALYKHNMERKLRESENKFRNVIEHSTDGIVLVDSHGILIEWNPAAEEISGLKRSDLIGQPIWDVIFHTLPASARSEVLYETLVNQWNGIIKNRFTSGLDHMAEMEIETPQGERRIVQSNGFAIGTDNGTLAGAIIRDITESKHAEEALSKSEALYRQAIEVTGAVPYHQTYHNNGIDYDFIGEGIREITGYGPEEFSETLWDSLAEERVLLEGLAKYSFDDAIQRVRLGSDPIWKCEHRIRARDGKTRWVLETAVELRDENQTSHGSIGMFQDITERKLLELSERNQRELAEALRDTALVLNSTLQLDNVLDRILENVGKLVIYDAALVLLVEGYTVRKIRYHSNVVKESLNQPQIGNTQANLINVPILQEMQQTKQPCLIPDTLADLRWRAIPGLAWIRSFISAPVEIRGHIAGLINIISAEPDFFTPLHAERLMAFADQAAIAIENARLFEQAHQLSITDPLTEINNRRHFFEVARFEFERTQRYKRNLSVMIMDIDHFKNINDTHGHAVGDLALCEIVARIKNSVRTVDIVARYGGEEFVVLMPETGLNEAYQIAERVRRSVADYPIENHDAIISATISLGVAEIGKNTKSLDELIKNADEALYKAKANGRNRVESYFP
jgi:diguanylate cyclase (GGDEF)-like protein/PAS domain S-box-containing protein